MVIQHNDASATVVLGYISSKTLEDVVSGKGSGYVLDHYIDRIWSKVLVRKSLY